MKNHPVKTAVFIATSLDGYIARSDGNIDWLMSGENPENDDFGYGEFIASINAIIMGRATFEKILSFPDWPYGNIPVFVLSSTRRSVPVGLEGKASFTELGPIQLLSTLASQGYNRLYIDGCKTIHSFLREDALDELIISTIPVFIGGGIRLFGHLEKDLSFALVSSKPQEAS